MSKNDNSFSRLRWLNLGAAAYHTVSAAALFALTDRHAVSPVHVDHTNDHRGNMTLYGPAISEIGSAKVGYLSGVFLLLAALDHFAVATFFRSTYEAQLRRSVNYFRWIEYSVSASVMHVMIAMLAGVMSLQLLLSIAGLTVSTMMFGLVQEMLTTRRRGRPHRKSIVPFLLGFVPHCICWTVIYITYGYSAHDAPLFVHFIMGGLFTTDLMFAVNMILQQWEIGWWKSYIWGEYMFVALSFTAKSMLAWTNFGGAQSL
jgi:hypothetical protein